jgi:16S rRNA U516 pseudouridylate synthase RsuA-like enzyme
VREGPLTLGDLPEGGVRSLTRDEVAALRKPSP